MHLCRVTRGILPHLQRLPAAHTSLSCVTKASGAVRSHGVPSTSFFAWLRKYSAYFPFLPGNIAFTLSLGVSGGSLLLLAVALFLAIVDSFLLGFLVLVYVRSIIRVYCFLRTSFYFLRIEKVELGFNTNGNWFTSTTKTYLTPSWIRDLFTFCDSHNIQLLDNCAKLPLRTTNDRFIMQILQCHYSGNDLRKLHQCQEFLQVLTISDICTADGRSLDNSMLSGRSTLRPRS